MFPGTWVAEYGGQRPLLLLSGPHFKKEISQGTNKPNFHLGVALSRIVAKEREKRSSDPIGLCPGVIALQSLTDYKPTQP